MSIIFRDVLKAESNKQANVRSIPLRTRESISDEKGVCAAVWETIRLHSKMIKKYRFIDEPVIFGTG